MQSKWFEGAEHQSFTLDGNRGTALLIHGFMGTPNEMRPLASELNREGFTARVPLLPGFGPDLGNLSRVGRKHWLSATQQIWGDLYGSGEADVLIGYSMGGAIALQLAKKYPPKRLILIAPLWKILGGDWRINLLPVIKPFLKNIRPFAKADFNDPGVRRFFSGAFPGMQLDDADVQKRIRKEVVLPTRTLDELRRLTRRSAAMAANVITPTLILQGTGDESVRVSDTRELAQRIPVHARLVEIDGDHMLVSDQQPTWDQVRHEVVQFSVGDAL